MLEFRAGQYGPRVAGILAAAGDGHRRMPLVAGPCASAEAREALARLTAAGLFGEQAVRAVGFAAPENRRPLGAARPCLPLGRQDIKTTMNRGGVCGSTLAQQDHFFTLLPA